MIPVLFEKNESEFLTNGIGRLTDCETCICTREQASENGLGIYEIEVSYPLEGIHAEDITVGRIIYAEPEKGKKYQPFVIYYISKPMQKTMTIKARHIALTQLQFVPVAEIDKETMTAAQAVNQITSRTLIDNPFTIITNINKSAEFGNDIPATMYDYLVMLRNTYGGEFEYDGMQVLLSASAGQDNNVEIRYGKNLTDIKQEQNIQETFTGAVAYWRGTTSSSTDVTIRGQVATATNAASFAFGRVQILDASADFQEAPTPQDLTTYATNYIEQNMFGVPAVSIRVSFVTLADTLEYKDIAPLEEVNLYDTITVVFPKFDVRSKSAITKTIYDVVNERYKSVTIGEIVYNVADVIAMNNLKMRQTVKTAKEWANYAAERATEALAGGYGGTIKMNYKFSDHVPSAQLILDNPDVNEAQRVIRNDINGTYVSRDGIDGEFQPIWEFTEDGDIAFYTDHITQGSTNGSLLKVGRIQSQNEVSDEELRSYWDLEQGILHLVGLFKAVQTNDPTTYAEIRDGHLYITRNGVTKVQIGVSRTGIGNLQFSNDGSTVTAVFNETGLRTADGNFSGNVTIQGTLYVWNGSSYVDVSSALVSAASTGSSNASAISSINATLANHEARLQALGG